MGLEFKMNTSFRPQTDGQTKIMNLVIQQFLRNYVAVNQQDWMDHLELGEFCYNNSEHSTTRSTPFWKVMGKSPTRLGGPFGVSRVLLQQFGTFRNWVHPISNGDG
jgi:hypothetical protein